VTRLPRGMVFGFRKADAAPSRVPTIIASSRRLALLEWYMASKSAVQSVPPTLNSN